MLTQNTLQSFRIALATMILIAAVGVAPGQVRDPATSETKVNELETLNMLVLGDSIMWGQGLRDRDKFWWRIRNWLQEKTGRRVQERIEAHLGAAIEVNNPLESIFTSNNGEVNLLPPGFRPQGTGRPTKRERREIDSFEL